MHTKSYFLITTAYEPSFKKNNSNNLFLGSWCFRHSDTDIHKNAEIVSYHWNDEKKLFLDYKKLDVLYERILIDLANSLNSFHKRNYSIRYWRIVVGPWLQYFIHIIFDRWEMINCTINNYSIENTICVTRPLSEIIPKNMNDFSNLYVTDEWNHQIYSKIINEWTQIQVIEKKDNIKKKLDNKNSFNVINFVKKKILLLLENLLKFFRNDDDIFLINTFLPFIQEFSLKLLLKQIPFPILEIEDISVKHVDLVDRQFIDLRSKEFTGFENCIRKLIPDNIPTSYFEDYNRIDNLVSNISWPKNPKAIITSINFHYDDIFKIWAANKVENKSQFIIMQHGGNMGSVKFNAALDHQIKVADKFISSGWKHNSNNFLNNQDKLYPFGILKNVRKITPSINIKGNIFMFGSIFPRYSYVLGSYPISSDQVCKHIHDQFSFVENISKNQFNRLRLKIFSPDWGWEQKKRWSNKFPKLKFSNENAFDIYKKARVCVMGYNGTTLLESLSRNIPTIVFLDPLIFNLHDNAKIYFDEIYKHGILRNSPIDSANQLKIVWDDIEDWWCNKDLQYAVEYFCDYFANNKKENIYKIRDCILKKI